jgi:8-oxo-dGTP diphosphatase
LLVRKLEDTMLRDRTVLVAAAVLIEGGRVLVTRRKAGTHLEGVWEFPGGKVLPGEDPRVGLRRELEEELGIVVTAGEILDVTFHAYEEADKAVLLMFFEVARRADSPDPHAIDVAEFAWAGAAELDPSRFPAADGPVLRKVKTRLAANG